MFYFIFYLRFDILHYNSCENDDEEFYKPVTLILKQLVKENYKYYFKVNSIRKTLYLQCSRYDVNQ